LLNVPNQRFTRPPLRRQVDRVVRAAACAFYFEISETRVDSIADRREDAVRDRRVYPYRIQASHAATSATNRVALAHCSACRIVSPHWRSFAGLPIRQRSARPTDWG